MIKKIFKWFFLSVLTLILVVILGGTLFLNLSPEFGGEHLEGDLKRYELSSHFNKDESIFFNEIETSMDMSLSEGIAVMVEMMSGVDNAQPATDIGVIKHSRSDINKLGEETQFIWIGHSTFLLKMNGENIILDPMFGDVPAPHNSLGNPRFTDGLPVEIKDLPEIDAVLISHDHYDHLDYGTVLLLKAKTKKFYCPLGVGAHLRAWGVKEESIVECDWWDEHTDSELKFVFTPSRHFSGRGLTDRFKTLWGSWVIQSNDKSLYFSGDGGYGPHFKAIGKEYGPFDLAWMECGQYNEKWGDIHMMPEESAQAGKDLNAKVIQPIHWGCFVLALHTWTDPVERVLPKAEELGIEVITPKIGEVVRLNQLSDSKDNNWWEKYQ